jgi:hypothetical protein
MRNKMLRLLLLCLIATGNILYSFSQTSPYGYAKAVDELLINVDKSGITSGLLYDRAYPSARLDLFNQMGNIDTTSPSHFGQAYYELFQAAYNNAPFAIGVDSLDDKINWYNFYNQIPIGILDCNMQQINPKAYTNKWVTINNDIVTNAPGETTDIYITKHPQLVCPMFNKAKAGKYQLLLEQWMVFSNTGLQVSGIAININGNSTYVAMGDKIDIELLEGNNLMQMHVYFTDGSNFTNMVKISTNDNSSLLAKTSANDAPPCFEMEVKATIPYKGYNENRFIKGKNKLSFFYADCNNQVLRKPIIILDGLDPEDKRNGQEIYNKWFNYYNYQGDYINLARQLRFQGFDVVIVNMPEYIDDDCPSCPPIMGGSDYIQRNAMVLVEIINQLNEQLVAAGSTEKLVIVGPSMGGQISRYALTYMEQKNMPHNCRLWVSFDSPHLGANLPIGLQHYINEMANMGSKDALKSRRINLEVPATREQLLDYAAAHNGFVDIEPKQDPMFTAYYNEQNTQGIPDPNNGNLVGWPVNCRKISMISGTLNGFMQLEGRPSEIALRTKTRGSNELGGAVGLVGGTLFFFFSSNPFTWVIAAGVLSAVPTQINLAKGDIYIAPSKNATTEVAYANYLFKNKTWFSKNTYSNIHHGSMDLLPAGNRAFFKEVKETSRDEWYTTTDIDIFVNSSGFIPTASSLALGKGKTPNPNRFWDDDLRGINLNCNYAKETPFDYYFGPGSYINNSSPNINLKHDSLFEEQANILLEEIKGVVHDNVQHYTGSIEYTQGWWCPNSTKVFKAFPSLPMKWTVTNSDFTIVSGQNSDQVIIKYNGNLPLKDCEIYAYFDDGCYTYSASTSVPYSLLVIPEYLKGVHTQGAGNANTNDELYFNNSYININRVNSISTDVKFSAPQLLSSSVQFKLVSSGGNLYNWQTLTNPRTGEKYLRVIAEQECDKTKTHTFSVTYKKDCPNSKTFTKEFTLMFCMPGARFLYSYNGQSVDVYLQKNQETKNDIIREYKEAQLFDLNGKLIVKSQLIVSNKFSLVTNKLSAGIYIVKLFHKNGQFETLKVSVR